MHSITFQLKPDIQHSEYQVNVLANIAFFYFIALNENNPLGSKRKIDTCIASILFCVNSHGPHCPFVC